ncbi:MFS transporter [Actinokineospora enzanensis]|uniref:MFS transporter n=1 Tax=Actinokineospora enzanensis TaxID=155975 RepID=UPI00037B062D|nr:MFS transporter [Actinokineospora enzanensis]
MGAAMNRYGGSGGAGTVRVLDIREPGQDLSFLDRLNRDTAHRAGLAGRVVVVDNTATLLANHERYQRLVSLGHVGAVVCVAVGPLAADGGTRLEQSAALGQDAVTVWVGDEWGSRWAGGSDRPRPVTDGPPGLDDLLAALRAAEVFDAVCAAVREVPHQTVSPGVEVVHPSVGSEELRALRATALSELVDHSLTDRAWPAPPASARGNTAPETGRDTVVSGSPLAMSAQRARYAAESLMTAAMMAPGLLGLLRGPRVDPGPALRAFEEHAAQADDALALIDRQAGGGDVSAQLVALGVPPADPPAHHAIATGLDNLLGDELRAGRSLRDLSVRLRQMSNESVPESGETARAELSGLRQGLRSLRSPTPPRLWDLPAIPLIVAAALTTTAVGWLTGSVIASSVLTGVWLAMLALMAVRLPDKAGRRPEAASALGAAAATAAAGTIVATLLPASPLPPAAAAVLAAVCLVLALGAVPLAWRTVLARWVSELRPAAVRQAVTRAESIVDVRVLGHVRGLHHTRRLSAACLLLASGTADLADLYHDRAGDAPRRHGSATELSAVLRADLVSLVRHALRDYLTDIGGDTLLDTDTDNLVANASRDLTAYHGFLDTHGVHARPPMVDDEGGRERLSRSLWQRSEAGRRVLRGDGREELVQLCRTGDTRSINLDWSRTRVLRFAPRLVQDIVLGPGSGVDVITTGADLTGVLRLMPLVPGRVTHRHPTHTEAGAEGATGGSAP